MLKMKKYANCGGNSGVSAYRIGVDSIDVLFDSGMLYTYRCCQIGDKNFQNMIRCANEGVGLNSYIVKYVGKDYFSKRQVRDNEVEVYV